MGRPGNGTNGAPSWARELSADMRALMAGIRLALVEAAEDRKRADEDRKRADEDRRQIAQALREAASDRRRYAEDSARRHQEFMGALREMRRTGRRLEAKMDRQTEEISKGRHEHGRILQGIHKSLRVQGNGRSRDNGNGHRAKS